MRVPSTSNTRASGVPQGTPGGISAPARHRAGQMALQDQHYLWILVIAEVLLMGWARQYFRRYHGG